MNPRYRAAAVVIFVLALFAAARARAQQGGHLSDDEADELREAQDPGLRIEVYLKLEQTRLDQMGGLGDRPAKLRVLLSQFLFINEEMKDWIQNQYDHHGDMRKGLRALLERGPQQLELLKQIQKWPGAANAEYASNLHDAIDSVTDGLNGATQAFADQQKMFGELKREQKANTEATKERIKEEKKRDKEEEKLRKRMERESKPDSDNN
jgi:hypothetical protein